MMIRTWLSRAVRRLRGKTPALRGQGSVPLVGPSVECNICDWRGTAFEGGAHSESAVCPSCNSISRDRFLHYCFTRRTEQRKGMRILETSPRLGKSYRDAMKEQFDYLCSDFDERAHKADLRIDMQAIDLPNNSLDVILTPHVLEHVPDTSRALAELHRVLRPGGKAFIQIPLLQGKTSVPQTPEYHGDNTLVYWRFGWDFTDKVREHGFECTALVSEQFQRQCLEHRSEGEPVSGEFDVDSILTDARPADLLAIADEATAVRHSFKPSYMFVTWECARPAGPRSLG